MADLLFKQAIAVIDKRTTLVCIDVAGQIKPVAEPFDTLAGMIDMPQFHIHCRTMVVPWMSGMVNTQRKDANKELMRRPLSQRDKRKYQHRIPPGDQQPSL